MKEKTVRTQINLRVTPEEKEMIKQKAEEKNTTITALVLNSVENNVTVNLDTSDYRDLVIQVRRIGNNINTILKRLHYTNFFEESDVIAIKKNQEMIEKELKEERKRINNARDGIEKLTPDKLRGFLKEKEKRIPNYLIYDEIGNQINEQLGEFIQIIKDEKANPIFRGFINKFIEGFYPTDFSYDELVSLSNEISTIIYKINQKIITETGNLTEEDFKNIMDILSKYRKDIDK
ncbi:plasmid mobilization protein [Senegalia sp. (in: firmicutes)]|uniref:plasmid mobilization protein n=1 Tax=Senegalia sp. (in: firmicutes) TaxID=1924098 RepID=UPI003F9A4552